MAGTSLWNEQSGGSEEAPVVFRRALDTSNELDMTPMIDCTFLLLIFFLVGSTPDMDTAVQLPPARHGVAADPRTSVIVTIAERGGSAPALVYLADGKIGTPLPDDPAAQEAAILQAVEQGHSEGKTGVLVKAERGVKHSDVARAAAVVGQVQGMRLYLAVLEAD